MSPDLLFEISTPLGFTVRCTKVYWEFLVAQKHPALKGQEDEVKLALGDPEEVRRSRKDPQVYLFYRGAAPRWICAVAKHEGQEGFLMTAYPADKIKIGEAVWTRSK